MPDPVRVQRTTTAGWESGAGNNVCTTPNFGASVTRGNRMIVFVRFGAGTISAVVDATIASCVDTLGTKYRTFIIDNSTDPGLAIIDGIAPASGTNAVTVTFSSSAANGPGFVEVVALEYAAPAGMTIRRDLNAAASGSHRSSGSTDMAAAAASTDGSSGFILWGCSQNNLTDYTLGANIQTLIDGSLSPLGNANHAGALGEKITTAPASSLTGHFTSGVTNQYCVIHAAWRVDVPAFSRRYLATSFQAYADGTSEALQLWETTDGISFSARPSEYWPSPNAHSQAVRNGTTRYANGAYWLVHSEATIADLFVNCPQLSVAKSIDGCTFVPFARIDCSGAGIDRAYGTHWDVDADGTERILFSAVKTGESLSKGYETHPVTPGDYSVWSTPAAIGGLPDGAGDVQRTRIGATYYIIFNDSGTAFRPLVYSSTSPVSGYSAFRTGDWMGDGVTYSSVNNDGPGLYIFPGNWLFYRDHDVDAGPVASVGAIYNVQAVGAGDWTGTNATAWAGPTTFGGSPLLSTIDIMALENWFPMRSRIEHGQAARLRR
jgi:hypothetical protein